MSEFKFACPVCGQHIVCESDKTGMRMECPNCFREIVVPQPPASEETKFVLTTSEVRAERPVEYIGPPPLPEAKKPPAWRDALLLVVALVIMAAAAAAVYSYRDVLFKPAPPKPAKKTNASAVATAPLPRPARTDDWSLTLEGVTLPDTVATGRLAGFSFTCERATLTGGTLNLRQGQTWPPDVGATIYLQAQRGEDLAGKKIEVLSESTARPPRIVLRWKDDTRGPVSQTVANNYAMRIEFGPVSSNRITGKIFLRIDDLLRSHIVGSFDAEIRAPPPPRQRQRR